LLGIFFLHRNVFAPSFHLLFMNLDALFVRLVKTRSTTCSLPVFMPESYGDFHLGLAS